jgi:hypothetical protein
MTSNCTEDIQAMIIQTSRKRSYVSSSLSKYKEAIATISSANTSITINAVILSERVGKNIRTIEIEREWHSSTPFKDPVGYVRAIAWAIYNKYVDFE